MNMETQVMVTVPEAVIFVTDKVPVIDKYGRAYATGRRKVASARVWIKPGTGEFTVNGSSLQEYFKRETLVVDIKRPFTVTDNVDKFDVYCTVEGSGLAGQAGAIRHAISRALDNYSPALYHNILKEHKFLTRDSRMVESKKYGRHKARRGTQFSKR